MVHWLNQLSSGASRQVFRKVCGATWWCDQMVAARPFVDAAAIRVAAENAFDRMPREAWLEAFGSHPKVGDLESLRMRLAGNQQWSAGEQAGVAAGNAATLQALADGNQVYEQRFGHVFIVCATGLTASEMLAQLQARMGNDAATELSCAGTEQRKITQLRLNKLTPPDASG